MRTVYLCAENNVWLYNSSYITYQVCGLETVTLTYSYNNLTFSYEHESGISNVQTEPFTAF